ncbi:MAG: hypothetical protein K9G59_19295 [Caulobacter sp.]|nr:hypothetical protein [Caulobacter sp.]
MSTWKNITLTGWGRSADVIGFDSADDGGAAGQAWIGHMLARFIHSPRDLRQFSSDLASAERHACGMVFGVGLAG